MVAVGGCSMVSGFVVLGGGMAHTLSRTKRAVVVMTAATVELGMVVNGLVVGRSVSSEMISGGGKGRKQGMYE